MLLEWRAVCAYLAEAVTPNQLKLTVLCDTVDMAVAKEITEAIKLLPQLKECTIRLGRYREAALTSLAHQTMQAAMHVKEPASPFRFFDLPKELRLHILDFTHLGVQGSHSPRYQNIRIEDNKLHVMHPRFANCCYMCNDTRDNCCCPTAYASASMSCVCRVVPFGLFLVSKLMYQDGQEVFFSANCFEFNQDYLRTLEFLNARLHVLGLIRRIRFVFSDKQIKFWKKERHKFQTLLQFVARHFNVANLCVVINTEANWDLCLWREEEEDNRFVYDAYCEIAQDLAILHGLQDLHLEFSWYRGLEVVLERQVMGSAYDSLQGKKFAKADKKSWGHWDLPPWHVTA